MSAERMRRSIRFIAGPMKRWKARRDEARRKKAENDLQWDYWIAKDAFERGDISAEKFFGDKRFFPATPAQPSLGNAGRK